MTKASRTAAWMGQVLLSVGMTVGCNVEPTDVATAGVDGGPPGRCPNGVTVVLSDYTSSQIALSALDGKTLSASFLSSASTVTDGLAFALSGDVAVPSTTPRSGQIVLMDRYGTNVVTWADPKTTKVTAQLAIGTGFESNPQDYLEFGDHLALVTRYGVNSDPGKQEFDAGSDALVLDLSEAQPKIIKSIPMPVADNLPPRPARMIRVGNQAIVPLERISEDFVTTGDSMFVGIDLTEQKIAWQTTLKGLKGCGRPALSPDETTLAVGCAGALDEKGNTVTSESAIVFFKAQEGELTETSRISAKDLNVEAVQSRVTYASDNVLLFATQTPWGGASNNELFWLDLDALKATSLLKASPDGMGLGKGLVYTGITCAPGCSNICLMADADKGVLERVRIADDTVELLSPVTVENKVGLPPTGIGLR